MHRQRPGGWISRTHKQRRPQYRRLRLGYFRWRMRVHANAYASRIYKGAVALTGTAVIIIGLILVPLPGPGWLIVLGGVAIIASEFHFARRLLHWARAKLRSWTDWLQESHWSMRVAVGGAVAACCLLAGWSVLKILGTPAWVPSEVAELVFLN